MADFVAKSTIKSAERILTTPFASKAAMNTIIGTVLADNPWGCTPYLSGGENLPAVQKSAENYTGTVIYENNDGKQVGRISIRAPSSGASQPSWRTLHLKPQWVEPLPMTVLKMDSVLPSNAMQHPGSSTMSPLSGRRSPSPVLRQIASFPPSKHGQIRCRIWHNPPIILW